MKARLLPLLLTFLLTCASAEVLFGGGQSVTGDYDELVLIGGGFNYAGSVDGDLVLIGGGNQIDAQVGGNAVLIGGGHSFDGKVVGDAIIVGGGNQLSGTVNEDAVLVGGGNTFRESSLVKGDLTQVGGGNELLGKVYGAVSGGEVEGISENRIVGLVGLPSFVGPGKVALFFAVMGFFGQLMLGALVVFLLLWLFNKPTLKLAKSAREMPKRKAWDGFVASLVAALLLVLATLTIVLAPISLTGLLALSMLFSVAKYFAYPGMVDSIFRLAGKKVWKGDTPIKFLLGALFYIMMGWIPLIGWVLRLYFNFVGFGALIERFKSARKKRKKSRAS